MSHKVNKLVFELSGAPRNESLNLQNRMSLFAHNELIPALEALFDKLVPADLTVRLDKMEINVKDFKLDGDFESQILEKLKSYLSPYNSEELIRTYPELDAALNKDFLFKAERKETADSNDFSELYTGIENKTQKLKELQSSKIYHSYSSLIHFLKNGTLSWNSAPLTNESIKELLKLISENEELSSSFINSQLAYNPQYILRIINSIGLAEYEKILIVDQLGDYKLLLSMLARASIIDTTESSPQTVSWNDFQKAVFMTVLKVLTNKHSVKLRSIIKELSEDLGKSFSETRKPAFSPVLKAAFSLKNYINKLNTQSSFFIPEENDNILLKDFAESGSESVSEVKPELLKETDLDGFFNSLNKPAELSTAEKTSSPASKSKEIESDSIASFLQEIKKAAPAEVSHSGPESFDTVLKTSKSEISALLNDSGLEEIEWAIPESPDSSKEEKTYFIENGGLVILAPFFTHMFKELGLKNGETFVDETARIKALVLTARLCFGDDEYQEHQLTLNKILCGFSPEDAVNLKLSLTELEKQTADELIEAAISYWTTLKNTGITAFRSTFLKRNGILSKVDKGNWLLRIERTAFDVLLDSLPWPISVHRYSWMKKLLTVEW